MTEFELFQALRPYYPAREYALLPQVANRTGSGAARHADALALSLWPSRGLHLSGFEMKSYRGDWMRELHDPEKAEAVAQYCSYWWIVASGPFVKDGELPENWGLMVWDDKAQALTRIKPARCREALKPNLAFIAAILRKAQEVVTPAAKLEAARAEGYEAGRSTRDTYAKYDLEGYKKLQEKVRAFEAASGLKISESWRGGQEIGEAVQHVLNGTVMRERNRLVATAKQILKDLGDKTDD